MRCARHVVDMIDYNNNSLILSPLSRIGSYYRITPLHVIYYKLSYTFEIC